MRSIDLNFATRICCQNWQNWFDNNAKQRQRPSSHCVWV